VLWEKSQRQNALLPSLFLAALLLSHNALAYEPPAQQFGGPSDCDDLSAIAPFTQINYVTMIQGIFDSTCLNCHGGGGGAGGLNLELANSYSELLAPLAPRTPRVVPGSVAGSRLFLKINCNSPGGGLSRMPMGDSALSSARQALIADWIRLGAPMLRAGFEDR
jgi:mono/diheme cytochrome c family protein